MPVRSTINVSGHLAMLSESERMEIENFKPISNEAIDREANRLHELGKRHMVVALLGKYGLFESEEAVDEYLKGTVAERS